MTHKKEIDKRAQAMIDNPANFSAILDEIANNPRWSAYLAMVLKDAKEVYEPLSRILEAAAQKAAEKECDMEKWALSQDVDLSETFFVRSEQEAA